MICYHLSRHNQQRINSLFRRRQTRWAMFCSEFDASRCCRDVHERPRASKSCYVRREAILGELEEQQRDWGGDQEARGFDASDRCHRTDGCGFEKRTGNRGRFGGTYVIKLFCCKWPTVLWFVVTKLYVDIDTWFSIKKWQNFVGVFNANLSTSPNQFKVRSEEQSKSFIASVSGYGKAKASDRKISPEDFCDRKWNRGMSSLIYILTLHSTVITEENTYMIALFSNFEGIVFHYKKWFFHAFV